MESSLSKGLVLKGKRPSGTLGALAHAWAGALPTLVLIEAGLGTATNAHAESRPAVVLSVMRESDALDCPNTSSVVAAVNERMGMRALVDADYAGAKDKLQIEVFRNEHGYKARISGLGRLQGQREVSSTESSCSTLSEALTVTLSVLIGLPTPEPLPPLPPSPPPDKPVLPPKTPTRADFGAGLMATLGLPKGWNYAVSLDASYRRAWWSLGGGVLFAPEQAVQYSPGKVDVSHTGAMVDACAVVDLQPRLDLRLCATPTVGFVRAHGEGYAPDRSVTRPWLSLGAGMELGGRLFGRLGWRARAIGLTPVNRQRFTIDQGGVAYDPHWIVGFAGISLTMSIW
jgi:hypothetical protein